ncbi:MAG: Ig-like domain-containing protein [Candidatus Hydrothermales bacterium]
MNFSKIKLLALVLFCCGYKAPPPGKPDIEAPSITILNLKEKDTIRDTFKIILSVEDKSKIVWVKLLLNGKEFQIDTIPPYEFLLPPPHNKWEITFQALDRWENLGNSKVFEIFGIIKDTQTIDTIQKK